MTSLDFSVLLDEDWADVRIRGAPPVPPPSVADPDLDADWAAVRGVPDHVYYLDSSANKSSGSLHRLPLPQLWRYKVVRSVHDNRFKDKRGWEVRDGKLLWTPCPDFVYHTPQHLPQSESYRTLTEACLALQQEHEGYIASLRADVTRYEQRAAEFLDAARCTNEAIDLIQSLDLTVKEG